jgi:hypothetical protein
VNEQLWVFGGEQRGVPHFTREWRLFKQALVVKVDNGQACPVLRYESPPEHRSDDEYSIVFKAGTIEGDRAYLCTQTEILVCDFPSFAIRQVISYPCFNDLHHVTVVPDGRLFVAVTGLDAVAEIAPDGALLRLCSVAGGCVWDRFSKDIDYRKVATTKPHQAHPNFVFFLHGRPWVTRFQQRDAIPLDGDRDSPFTHIDDEGIHDGHVTDDAVYFTSVNGHIIVFDRRSGARTVLDLNAVRHPHPDRPLGWCRGLLPSRDHLWVGFTRIRYTALRTNVDWVRRGFRKIERQAPCVTRLARYERSTLALVEEIELESAGMNAIFSIHSGNGAPR